jgi:hypothetical protein
MISAGWANSCGKELFTIGWVPCAVDAPASPSTGGGRGSGPTNGIRPEHPYRPRSHSRYDRGNIDALEETRRARILSEDDDIVALIAAMLSRDML